MPSPSYQIWLRDINSDTLHLDLTNWIVEMEWTRVVSEVGGFSMVLPDTFPQEFLNLDSHLDWRVEIWRRADESSPLRLENIGLMRRVVRQTDEDGKTFAVVSGPDLMHILTRRVVLPWDLRTQNPGSGYAADHMRFLVRTQFINATNTLHVSDGPWVDVAVPRSLPTVNGWTFSCEADTGTGDALTNMDGTPWYHSQYAGQGVMDSLKKIYGWSIDPQYTRSRLYFTIDFDDYKLWTFRVHPGRVGMDHSGDSGQPVFIGLDYGNLTIPVLDHDRGSEYNSVFSYYGSKDYLTHYALVDTTRMNHSCINYTERCASIGDFPDAYLSNVGMMRQGLSHKKFSGSIVNGPGCAYGREWGFGDEVVISFLGQQYEADVVGIRAKWDSNGNENMQTMVDIPLG